MRYECERARGVIKETEELEHFGCYMLPRYSGPRNYRELVMQYTREVCAGEDTQG
jgi:hypothetical protein